MTDSERVTLGRLPEWLSTFLRSGWLPTIHRRLSQVLETAKTIPFDDSSRFVFFSDLHRGDGSHSDSFLPNAGLFLNVLSHYERNGFSYVEVGDGDELWKGWPFEAIREAHKRVFELLHQLDLDRRLQLIIGNHDMRQKTARKQMEKDGLPVHEGIVMRHAETAQQLFVVHGHQADITNDRLVFLAHRAVRLSKRLRGMVRLWNAGPGRVDQMGKLEQRITDWIKTYQEIVICGHTHRPAFPKIGEIPYFNTGSGVVPGILTGLELRHGALVPIRWTEDRARRPVRELAGPPRRINW